MPPAPVDRRLILFGRYPVPGQTKTRLIPVLGLLGAAELQRRLTERTLAILTRSYLAPVDFVFTGGTLDQMRRWLGENPVYFKPQSPGELGERMQRTIGDALAQGTSQVVLVGTDIPEMTSAHLSMAFDALADHDVVLGPSNDGGYWLVGCRRQVDIFRDIKWGTPDVLARTLSAARRQGLSTALLPPLNDIDTEKDLIAWQPDRQWQKPYLSVVIPTLNEAARIARTIGHVQSADIETIVADGGSQDGTGDLARRAGAKVIQTRRGRASQQNAGARQAAGRTVLFLHADTRLPDDFGAQVFELLMDPKVVLGAFRFKTDWDRCTMRWIERAAHIRSTFLNMPYGDQALFMRKSLFDQIGGFRDVPIAEDLFLVRQLGRMGRVAIAPGAAVTSGRRWQALGVGRTTVINYLIAAGCLAGVDPKRLLPLHRAGKKRLKS